MISYEPDVPGSADFDLGTMSVYTCNEGYQLITHTGSAKRTCVDGGGGIGGMFNGTKPHCELDTDQVLYCLAENLDLASYLLNCQAFIHVHVVL